MGVYKIWAPNFRYFCFVSCWGGEGEREEESKTSGGGSVVIGSEGQKYTPKVFSALKTQVPQQAQKRKRGLVYTKKLVFKRKRGKVHIHQRAFKVFVGDPFAQYWCIDFGLLIENAGGVGRCLVLGAKCFFSAPKFPPSFCGLSVREPLRPRIELSFTPQWVAADDENPSQMKCFFELRKYAPNILRF